jgi:hypothetical protein
MEIPTSDPEQRRERAELDARFGQIGISAVAAALRYRSEAKNPAYAPAAEARPAGSKRPRHNRGGSHLHRRMRRRAPPSSVDADTSPR